MNTPKRTKQRIGIIILLVVMAIGGGYYWYLQSNEDTSSTTTNTSTSAAANIDTTDEEIDWTTFPTTNVTLSNSTLTISEAGTYVLTGSTTAGIVITSDSNVRLVLDNATISNSTGAAIVAEDAEYVVIQTQNGTTNIVSDANTRTNADIDSVIYAQNNLSIIGEGTLNVTANYAHGVVSKDDLKITSGTINVTSVEDGLRGRDSVTITGGAISIKAKGHGIKSNNDEDATKANIYINGGDITISAEGDGIKAEERVLIDDGTINITTSTEGIEAAQITINSGTINIYATDDGINGSASTFTSDVSITITGGDVTVEVGAGDTDALDSNGDLTISGGIVRLIGVVSTVDYDGTGIFSGGTLILNGTEVTSLPTQMMGGAGQNRR